MKASKTVWVESIAIYWLDLLSVLLDLNAKEIVNNNKLYVPFRIRLNI